MKTNCLLISRIVLIVCVCFVATPAFAASTKLSCELSVQTQFGLFVSDDTETIYVEEDEVVALKWRSTNAKKAFDDNNKKIATHGEATTTIKNDTTLTYRFENGSSKTSCNVQVKVVQADFNQKTLTSASSKPTLSGTVTGSKTVRLLIYKEDSKKVLFTSKLIKVKKGTWSTKVTKALPNGTYDVVLIGDTKNVAIHTIGKDLLTIGEQSGGTTTKSSTTFYAESVPLLSGGTARAGTTVPVVYLQLLNIGKTPGVVTSLTVAQKGTAQTSTVVGFVISDSTTSSIVTVGSAAKPIAYTNGRATIPYVLPMKAGESRLITIKAILAPTVVADVSKKLTFEVRDIATNAIQKATFPIRGVTWTLGL
jgi:hypothetical protein